MKKILNLVLILTLVMGFSTTSFAANKYENVNYSKYATIAKEYFDKTIPQNVSASFKHKSCYSLLDDHLQVSFDEVSYATSYDILIGIDDNFSDYRIYTSTTNFVMISPDEFLGDCPNGYVVKVRARYGKYARGAWSKVDVIGCNKLHI